MVIVEPTFHQQKQQYCSKFCCINSPCHSDTAGRCPQKLDLPPILCKPNHSTRWHDIHPFCWFSPKNFSLMPFPVNFRIQEDQLYQEWVYRVWKQHKQCSTAFEFGSLQYQFASSKNLMHARLPPAMHLLQVVHPELLLLPSCFLLTFLSTY